jgi:hypothetical protein
LKQKIKNRFIVILLIIASLYLVLTPRKVNSVDPVVQSVSHQPTTVSQGTNVTITIVFTDDENVTGVRILYCSLEPEYQCHIPQIDMINPTTNNWIGSFVVLEEGGIIGYQLHIDHTGGTFIAPNSSNYLGHDNIAEPYADSFYFTIELSTPTGNTPLSIGFPAIVVYSLIYLIYRRRNN